MLNMNEKNTNADRPTSSMGPGVHVKGDITSNEDLLIDGSVEGLIQLDERKLTVGPKAKLTAEINARDVVVLGYVKGNVHAKGRIVIKKDGAVIGNLRTAYITIEEDAEFRGSLEIERPEAEERSSRAASASA